MKGLIVAGGKGKRLRPLTHTKNKTLLPIANKPMIFHMVERFMDIDINEIIFSIRNDDDEFKKVINEQNKIWKLKIHFQEEKPEDSKGMFYPIKLAEKLIGSDSFAFAAGDNILSWGLQKHRYDFEANDSDGHVLVVKSDSYEKFGVAILDGNKVVKTVEKPKEKISDLILTGIYFFKPVVFSAFDNVKPIDPNNTGRAEYYPPVINNWLIDNGYKFSASLVTGWWTDTGNPTDFLRANVLILDQLNDIYNLAELKGDNKIEGRVRIEKGVVIRNSILRGPIVIDSGTRIENSYIGPYTSIGKDCEILNSEIENSIVFGGNLIAKHRERIDSSIIGWNTDIIGKTGISTNSYIVGDDSIIKVL